MKNKSALTVIFFTVFIDLLGFGLLIPILPTFASNVLHISDFEIGVIVGSYSLMQFLFNSLVGKLSDKLGRRPVILVSLLITAVSYIIFSFSTSFWILLISRLLAGLGGSNIGAAQAYIADITTAKDRSKGMGLIGAAFGLGFVFGPVIGGILSTYSYSLVGYVSAGFSTLAFIFAFFSLKESNENKKNYESSRTSLLDLKFMKEVFSHPQIGLLISLFFIIIFSVANIYGTFALLGSKVYGFSDMQTGYLFGISGIVTTLIQGGLIKRLSGKFSERGLVLFGIVFMTIGLGFLPYGINFLGVAIVISLLSVGTGILQPTILSMVSKYSPEDQQGSILGLNQSISALARVLGPLWGGFAYEYIGYEFPFLTGAFFTILSFFVAFKLIQEKRFSKG